MTWRLTRLLIALVPLSLCGACSPSVAPPGPAVERPTETASAFVMSDGMVLPYRAWLPKLRPNVVILALHGMNDSRDAWEYAAPRFAAAGVALYAPDLRGFGATASRGRWPGARGLTADIATMTRMVRAHYPGAKLILMAESMGAAALMVLATQPGAPPVDGYVLIAPAVWGRAEMNPIMRTALWLADHIIPTVTLAGGRLVKVTATDNRQALDRLAGDPLTVHRTRVDAINGLVNLMDDALAAAPHISAPALFLYGGHDQLIPKGSTRCVWRALPTSVTRAFYPEGYHLLLRDSERGVPIEDILDWIANPRHPLRSGADSAASEWMAGKDHSFRCSRN